MKRISTALVVSALILVGIGLGLRAFLRKPAAASISSSQVPRTPDGKPDLNGIWQALNRAHWDLQSHPARIGPLLQMGALGAIPAGIGVVEGGEIPYQTWAAEKKKANAEHWLERDPAVKCYLPGIPRATYMPFPFQIVQTPQYVMMAYEFASASRTIYMDPAAPKDTAVDTWMGWSRGRWEGDSLVIDINSFNDQTWFDASGDFHSEALRVSERYTRTDVDHLLYEATIDDPKVFTRPWKIRMPLYRVIDSNEQLLEFKCVEFVEELMYGQYRKKSTD